MILFMDKAHKERWLPLMFDLLYDNMRSIAPSGLSRQQEQAQWLREVSPALDKPPRQVVLCLSGGVLCGFLQYYIRNDMLMVEELQLRRSCQCSTLFASVLKFMLSVVPQNVNTVEAYADRRNVRSIALMRRVGMDLCGNDDASPYVHFSGELTTLRRLLRRHMP